MGNITSYTQSGTTYTYTYDDQNQLLTQTGGGKTYTYTYDNAGNIRTASNGTTTNSYTYGNALWRDQLTAFNGQTITYDASGNPLSYYNGKRYTFTWEEGRNLVSAVQGTNTYTYAYDSSGLRVSKTVNGVKHEYLYASGKLLRETYGDVILDFVYDHSGHPFALRYTAGGTTTNYYYITNLQGDVLNIITGNGVVVASYSYDPYGKALTATGEMADVNPLRYRGYYYDTETGFYYLQSRYYDPTICRFVNSDTYASTGQGIIGFNMFAYCNNNPISRGDATGTFSIWVYLWKNLESILLAVGDVLKMLGYNLTGKLLMYSTSKVTESYTASAQSDEAKMIASDPGFCEAVRKYCRGESEETTYTFPLSADDPSIQDLAFALHDVEFSCEIEYSPKDKKRYIAVTVTDTFDFTEIVNPLAQDSLLEGLIWAANDLAVLAQKSGKIHPFDVTITVMIPLEP